MDDFNIPLLLKTTVFDVVGKDRIEGVYYGQVDEKYNRVESSRKFLPCDTLILSVGLVPETDLINMPLNRATKSIFVNDYLESQQEGVFACGNFLHVHDLVDNVSLEAMNAGKNASDYALGRLKKSKEFKISHANNISYVVPATIHSGLGLASIKFRVKSKVMRSNFVIKNAKGDIIVKKFTLACLPGEMQVIEIDRSLINSDIILEVSPL